MLKNIKGAVFDMDGTLVDSLMVWDILWEKLGRTLLHKEGFRPSREDDKAVRTMTLKAAMEMIHQNYNMGESGEMLHCAADDMMAEFYAGEVQLKPGVLPFLEYLQEKGVPMCIASATDMRLVSIAMEHCGIGHFFKEVISCAAVGKGKDEPDVFLEAMRQLGTQPGETCLFEDSHIAIRTASSIGMMTVGIYDRYNYGQEEMQRLATVYLPDGMTMKTLIDQGQI